jgi:hypothetical protein
MGYKLIQNNKITEFNIVEAELTEEQYQEYLEYGGDYIAENYDLPWTLVENIPAEIVSTYTSSIF